MLKMHGRVVLLIDHYDLAVTTGVVRDFRSAIDTVMLGPGLLIGHGAECIRSIEAMPTTWTPTEFASEGRLAPLADIRYCGSPDDAYNAGVGVSVVGARGFTVSGAGGMEMVRAAFQGAAAARALRPPHRRTTPLPIVAAPPASGLSGCRRVSSLAKLAKAMRTEGIEDLLVEAADTAPLAKRRCGVRLWAACSGIFAGTSVPEGEDVVSLLVAGAQRVLVHSVLLTGDISETADRLSRRVAELDPRVFR